MKCQFADSSRKLSLAYMATVSLLAVVCGLSGMAADRNDLSEAIDVSDPTNGGFWNTENRELINVFAATSGVAAVNGEFRSIGESRIASLRSDSFRALTIAIR